MAKRPATPKSPFIFDNGLGEDEVTDRRGYQTGGRLVPIPDPTALTSKLVASAINDFRREMETRLAAMDKAADLLHEDYTRVPTATDRAIFQLRELLEAKLSQLSIETNEKFTGVSAQFSERDTRTDQRAGDTKLAVDAAFAAAKEATAKIEAGFTKQIDSMIGMIDTKTANLDARISDIKDRQASIEARQATFDGNRAGGATMLALVISLVVAGNAVVGFAISLVHTH